MITVIRKVIGFLLVLLILLTGLKLLHSFFFEKIVTKFDVTAITEHVRTTISSNNSGYLNFRNASTYGQFGLIDSSFTGSCNPTKGTELIVNRIGFGHLKVVLKREDGGSVGTLSAGTRNVADIVLKDYFEFVVTDLKERGEKGQPVVIPIIGDVHLGRSIGFETLNSNPAVLREGRVVMFGKSDLSESYYEAGSIDLLLGDQFYFNDASFSSSGFAIINEGVGINVAYETVAKEASIVKPGILRTEEPLKISTAMITRFVHDRFFQGVSVLFAVLFALLGIITFFFDFSGFRGSLDKGKKIPTLLLVSFLVTLSSSNNHVFTQSTVWVKASEMGRGVTKERAGETYIILPQHVVPSSRGLIQIVGESNVQGTAKKVRSFPQDLALLKVTSGGVQKSREWDIPNDFRQVLESVTDLYIELRQKGGTSTRMDIRLVSVTDDHLFADLKYPDRSSFEKGMSGGSVFGSYQGRCTYIGMLTEIDTKTKLAKILQADDIDRTISRFFDLDQQSRSAKALIKPSTSLGPLERDVFLLTEKLHKALHELKLDGEVFIGGIEETLGIENELGAYIKSEIENVLCSQDVGYRFSCSKNLSDALEVHGKIYQGSNAYKVVLKTTLANGRRQALVNTALNRTPSADAMFGQSSSKATTQENQHTSSSFTQKAKSTSQELVAEGVVFSSCSCRMIDRRLSCSVSLKSASHNMPVSVFVRDSYAQNLGKQFRISQAQGPRGASSVQLNLQLSPNQATQLDFWIDGTSEQLRSINKLTLQIKKGGGFKKPITLVCSNQ